MKRSKPLARRVPLRTRSPLRPATRRGNVSSAPKRKPGPGRAFWQAQREALYVRANGRCERCGTDLNDTGMEAHHRKLRSQGGGHDLINLAALCPTCHHDHVHAHPGHAETGGWIVPSWGDPATRPLLLHDGRAVRLTSDGGYDVCFNEDGEPTP